VGAEFYPQCINLKITGNGTKSVRGGVDARTLYTGAESGVAYRTLHETRQHVDYVVPGPRLWSRSK
jgi:cellulase